MRNNKENSTQLFNLAHVVTNTEELPGFIIQRGVTKNCSSFMGLIDNNTLLIELNEKNPIKTC